MTDRALPSHQPSQHPRLAAASEPARATLEDLHELRVRIPVDLHRQLLSLKVLRGRSLADTVSIALDHYFAKVKAPPEERDAEPRHA